MEIDLLDDGVDGAEIDPSLDGEGEDGEGEVGGALEEDVSYQAVVAAFPLYKSQQELSQTRSISPELTIHAKQDEHGKTNAEQGRHMGVGPSIRIAGPVERQEDQRGTSHEYRRADGVAGPEVFSERHLGVV